MSYTKASIVNGLPYGDIGRNSIVCSGKVDYTAELVALKMSLYTGNYSGNDIEKAWSEELDKSCELSRLLPNTADYHRMIEIEQYPEFPTFSMDIVKGFPIIDINISCYDPRMFKDLLKEESLDQLADSLNVASKNGWNTSDLQYFILLEDQVLKKNHYRRGDLILFDFGGWHRESVRGKLDVDDHIKNLKKLIL